MKQFNKILIANRGEIAVRIIRTAKQMGISTSAVYAEDDKNSLHVYLADEAVLLEGSSLSDTYLNQKKLIQIAKEIKAGAIHPGYGFLSENASFAELVEENGLVFIGAAASQIALMGEKIRANEFVKSIGVPTIPGLQGHAADILEEASALSFPLLIKASAGGGGKGMQIAESATELPGKIENTRRQAHDYFGNGEIFVEKYIPKARHIEVQVFGDGNGNAVHLFERECSIQRRYQKLIEEAPAASISNSLKEKLHQTAVHIAKEIKYKGAGTVEFLVDEQENFYFLEMNTRLQVEHPVTEMITGLDLVEWQIFIAMNGKLPLSQTEVNSQGHAIELRLCAEDPLQDFHPSSGTIKQFEAPKSVTARFDHFLNAGITLSPNYDSLLGKLIVHAENRQDAIGKLSMASVLTMIPGIKTNLSFLNEILKDQRFVENDIHTRFVEDYLGDIKIQLKQDQPFPQKIVSAISYVIHHFVYTESVGSIWERTGSERIFPEFELSVENEIIKISFFRKGDLLQFNIEDEIYHVASVEKNGVWYAFKLNGVGVEVGILEQDQCSWIQFKGHQSKVSSKHVLSEAKVNKRIERGNTDETSHIHADLFGKIVQVHIGEGEQVQKDQVLITLESMKTEFRILSPSEGKIKQLHVEMGSVVQDKQLLIEFETEKN